MRERVLEPAREEVAPQARPAQPAPSLARIMALQRSAGNQAVTRLLSRWEEEDEDSAFRKKHKRKLEEAFLLHMTHFMGDLRSWPRVKELSEYKSAAKDPDDLIVRLNADIVLAKAWKLSEDAKPSALEQIQSAAAQKPKEEPKKEKKKKEKKEKEAPVSLDEFNASLPEVNKWEQALPEAMTTAEEHPLMPGQILPPTTAVFTLSEHTAPIEKWSPVDHAGKEVKQLTLKNVEEIVEWLKNSYSRKGKVFIGRGEGSGSWTGKTQLKIIHKTQFAPDKRKKATYHLTLDQGVYDKLTVPEIGAEWVG